MEQEYKSRSLTTMTSEILLIEQISEQRHGVPLESAAGQMKRWRGRKRTGWSFWATRGPPWKGCAMRVEWIEGIVQERHWPPPNFLAASSPMSTIFNLVTVIWGGKREEEKNSKNFWNIFCRKSHDNWGPVWPRDLAAKTAANRENSERREGSGRVVSKGLSGRVIYVRPDQWVN